MRVLAWLVAAAWIYKVAEAALGIPRITDLLGREWDRQPADAPSLTVIVPACNEAEHVGACLESLMSQDYGSDSNALRVIAVDDRSKDRTGALMDAMAAASPERLRVLHIETLPTGWLGKTHAMALAAAKTDADWLLFTDADVLFRADSLRRSMAYALESGADHLVTVPTTIRKRWDEGMLLGFFQIFGLWGPRPWKIANPQAKRDSIGVGAFNLIRRSAYEQIGGFEALRMEVVEDLGLGRRVKRFGLAQRIAFGQGLVRVHWASGALGLMQVMTKNVFAAARFSVPLVLLGCVWLLVFCVAPVLWLLLPGGRFPALLTLATIALAYRLYGRASGISTWQAVLSPVAAMLFVFTLLRSMLTTLRQGGVVWRGTFYPLKELRKRAAPLF